MRLFVIAAVVMLAGCATKPLPGIEVRTVEVVREVQAPCPVEAPVRPAPVGPQPANAADAVRVLAAKLLEYVGAGGYAERAESALAICRSGGG